jgi:hypothetical protein
MTCRTLQNRTMPTRDWKMQHAAHLPPKHDFTLQEFDTVDDAYKDLCWLVCPCGAMHLIIKESAEVEAKAKEDKP